ncbi:MAG: hypothetical protein K0Q81_1368, partial [Paenibacillus sp.]|nr:hypothetical protein [Paenibacillus sp.]
WTVKYAQYAQKKYGSQQQGTPDVLQITHTYRNEEL